MNHCDRSDRIVNGSGMRMLLQLLLLTRIQVSAQSQWINEKGQCAIPCRHGGNPNGNCSECVDCDTKWTGTLCDTTTCSENSSPVLTSNVWTCSCHFGWEGPDCDVNAFSCDLGERTDFKDVWDANYAISQSGHTLIIHAGASLVTASTSFYSSRIVVLSGGEIRCDDKRSIYIRRGEPFHTSVYVQHGAKLIKVDTDCFENVPIRFFYEPGAEIAWPSFSNGTRQTQPGSAYKETVEEGYSGGTLIGPCETPIQLESDEDSCVIPYSLFTGKGRSPGSCGVETF